MATKFLQYLSGIMLLSAFSITSFAFSESDFEDTSDLYSIEVIVFKFNQLEDSDTSLWKPTLPLTLNNAYEINAPKKVEFINAELPPPVQAITPLSPAEYLLKREKNRIANNNQYTLLLHTGWKQKLSDLNGTKSVHIHGGAMFDRNNEDIDEIDGTITISKNRFINIKTNLFLTEPSYEIAEISNGLFSYPMQNSRRTKENELNYIDNPVFGLLIKITPPQEKETA